MSGFNKTDAISPQRCNFCGVKAPVVWVHGHGQCAHCGINVDECCRGEQCNSTKMASPQAVKTER